MTNLSISLNRNNSLSFLVNDKLKGSSHYISSQPMEIFIPYPEYFHLVEMISALKLDVLRNPLNVYSKFSAMGVKSKSMIRLYHLDIALSGLHELEVSGNNALLCTAIYPSFDDSFYNEEMEFITPSCSKEFFITKFTDVERDTIREYIKSNYNIPLAYFISNEEMKPNLEKYYFYSVILGTAILRKKFQINILKEEDLA